MEKYLFIYNIIIYKIIIQHISVYIYPLACLGDVMTLPHTTNLYIKKGGWASCSQWPPQLWFANVVG